MKIVFFGSSQFAVPSLNALVASGHDVVLVVTQPDRCRGRHLLKCPTPVKEIALKHKLKIIQPESIKSPAAVAILQKAAADIFAVVSYGQILSQEILDIPSIMPLNIHASLLPKYRGAAPINWALINGDTETGVTSMKITRKMDSGPLISQKRLRIEDTDDVIVLEKKLAILGADLLIETINKIKENKYTLVEQNEKDVVLAPKLKKSNGLIDWNKPAGCIHNLIRGCLDWPGAFTYYKGKLLKIYKAQVQDSDAGADFSTGEIVQPDKKTIIVKCAKEYLAIKELQTEGKRRMSAEEFILGHKISAGDKFTASNKN